MRAVVPTTGELVLVGGGHAQVALLKSLAMKPVTGLRTTLICPDVQTPYSGMLPGYVEGVWKAQDIHIDLARLTQMAGARLIVAAATRLAVDDRLVHVETRPPVHFDILSVNVGGAPDLNAIQGAADHCIPVKPIGRFRSQLAALTARGYPQQLAIIGGGAAGCELALALSKQWQDATGRRPEITIFARGARLVPEMPARAARLIFEALTRIGATVHCGRAVTSVEAGSLQLQDGSRHEFGACFLVTSVAAPQWIADSGLDLDEHGFLKVNRTLQSSSHPFVFAAGDIASIADDKRPKSGVYAVRAGPVLAHNVRQHLHGRRLKRWSPQSKALAIIGTADGKAIAVRGAHASASRAWWWLKTWIDRRWMAKYKNLHMQPPPNWRPFAGISSKTAVADDPVFESMRCLGCGAKTGHETLAAAMKDATAIAVKMGADPRLMPPEGLEDDSAVLPVPEGGELLQSTDVISEIVGDPFLLGKIAAVHAMSDIYAANGVPVWAMANVTMGMAKIDLQQHQLAQLMAGSLVALSEAGAQLVGGHTGESQALGIGFTVTGWRKAPPAPPSEDSEIALILTKPIGTGVIMAAHMQLAAQGEWVEAAIASMAEGNAAAASALAPFAPLMTDVTGFGLARHALNLAGRCARPGAELDPAALPCLDGALMLIERGHRSTLHHQNRAAVRMADAALSAPAIDILFDPQTSGGLLAAVPEAEADSALARLHEAGINAARVGRLTDTAVGLSLSG